MNTHKKTISYHDFSQGAIAELLMESMDHLCMYATEFGYQQSGDFPSRETLAASLGDSSHCMNKRLIKGHFFLQRKLSLRSANRFLHFICVKLLNYDSEQEIPRIDYSEKEAAIKIARTAWVKARDEAEELRLAYAKEKADFYKS